ncbi:PPR superfamily protein [Medicago truncatula]|uniref:PPR superfamily protein n=1 Tax=Medicago truncatula TaxID=3880 RepID=A0A072VS02_MEDTR|nr:PPR superfamily protein [Medicago truncatula]
MASMIPILSGVDQLCWTLHLDILLASIVYSSMIHCLCYCGNVDDAEIYLRIMKGRLLAPNVSIYETLITGHAQKGNNDSALQLRIEMASLELQHS